MPMVPRGQQSGMIADIYDSAPRKIFSSGTRVKATPHLAQSLLHVSNTSQRFKNLTP